ncbi:MAG: molybdopterin-dependent oxidoreductase [Methanomassiliicoccales archaeon]
MGTLPPGQFQGKRFVIYTINGVPEIREEDYKFELYGRVENKLSLSYAELCSVDNYVLKADFHCVTRWSIKDCEWKGVRFSVLAERAGVHEEAAFAYAYSLDGYTTVIPYENMHDAILATSLNGQRLSNEQGYPIRLVVPSLYGWKSAKWLSAIELLDHYRDGYWEERGYHERGDFNLEERFSDPAARYIHKKVANKK